MNLILQANNGSLHKMNCLLILVHLPLHLTNLFKIRNKNLYFTKVISAVPYSQNLRQKATSHWPLQKQQTELTPSPWIPQPSPSTAPPPQSPSLEPCCSLEPACWDWWACGSGRYADFPGHQKEKAACVLRKRLLFWKCNPHLSGNVNGKTLNRLYRDLYPRLPPSTTHHSLFSNKSDYLPPA